MLDMESIACLSLVYIRITTGAVEKFENQCDGFPQLNPNNCSPKIDEARTFDYFDTKSLAMDFNPLDYSLPQMESAKMQLYLFNIRLIAGQIFALR